MSNTTQNTDLIPKDQLAIWKQGLDLLDQYDDKIMALLAPISEWNAKLAKNTLSLKEQAQVIKEITSAEGRYNTLTKERETVLKSLEKWQSKKLANDSEEAKKIQEIKVQIQQQNKEYREQAKAALELAKAKEQDAKATQEQVNASKAAAETPFEVERYRPLENKDEQAERIRQLHEERDAIMEASRAARAADSVYNQSAESKKTNTQQTKELTDAERYAANAFAETSEEAQTQIRFLVELENEIAALKKERKDLDVQYKNGAIIHDEYIQRKAELIALEQQQTTIAKDVKATIEQETKEVTKYDDSIIDLNSTISIFDRRAGTLISRVRNISGVKKAWLSINDKLVKSLGLTVKQANLLQGAIIGLVIYGLVKLVEWSKRVSEERLKMSEATEREIKINEEAAKSVGPTIAAYKSLQIQWNNLAGDIQGKTQFITDNKKEFEKLGYAVTSVDDAEALLVQNTDAVIKAMSLRARAAAYTTLAAQEYEKAALTTPLEELPIDETDTSPAGFARSQQLKGIQELGRQAINEAIKQGEEYTAKAVELEQEAAQLIVDAGLKTKNDLVKITDDLAKERERLLQAEAKARENLELLMINDNADALKRISDDDKKSYEDRLTAFNAYTEEMRNSLETSSANQIDSLVKPFMDAGMSREDAEQQVWNQIVLIRAKAQIELDKIDRDGEEGRLSLLEGYLQKKIDTISKYAEQEGGRISQTESADLAELARQYAKGIVNAEQYQARRTEITRKAANDRFDAEVNALKEALNLANLTEEQRLALEEQIGKSRIDYEKYVNDQIISDEEDAAKRREEIEQALVDKRKELMSGLVSFASALYSNFTQSRLDSLKEEGERSQDYYDEERDRVERLYDAGAISKEEADARKRKVDDDEAQRQKEREAQEKQIQRDQFVFEQTVAVAKIIQGMASAIFQIKAQAAILAANPLTAPLAALALAQIPGVIANAGIQTGIILAQTIPAYAEGTDVQQGHKGGWAVVGDGGRPEMIVSPRGQTFKTPSIPTLMDLPKGSIVYPDWNLALQEMHAMAAVKRLPERGPEVRVDFNTKDIIESNQEVTKAVNTFMAKYQRGTKKMHSENVKNNLKQPIRR